MRRACITTSGPDETLELAARLGRKAFPGMFVGLYGDLGAGKTLFVKGLAKGLEVEDHMCVVSPTFVIMREYEGALKLAHFDLYRLNEEDLLRTVDHEDYFYSGGVAAVEWADRLREVLPEERLDVELAHGSEENVRRIRLAGLGKRHERLLEGM